MTDTVGKQYPSIFGNENKELQPLIRDRFAQLLPGSKPLKSDHLVSACQPSSISAQLGALPPTTPWKDSERALSPPLQKMWFTCVCQPVNPCDVFPCLCLGGANKVPALGTDLRPLKIQDWMNSGKDDKLMPLITQRCAATGARVFKCLWKCKALACNQAIKQN